MRSGDRFTFCQEYSERCLNEHFDAIMYIFELVDLNKSIACDGYAQLESGMLFTCSVNTSNIPMETLCKILKDKKYKLGKEVYKIEPYILTENKINIKMMKC